MRKLSNCNKNNLLDNPGKILRSNFRSKPTILYLEIVNHVSNFLLASKSCRVCRCLQRISEWMTETLSTLSIEMSHPNTNEELIAPLSQTLSHQKNHPSLSVWFVFLSSLWFAKQRVSEEIPYFALERQMRWEERWRKKNENKMINNGNQKCQIHNTKGYLIL